MCGHWHTAVSILQVQSSVNGATIEDCPLLNWWAYLLCECSCWNSFCNMSWLNETHNFPTSVLLKSNISYFYEECQKDLRTMLGGLHMICIDSSMVSYRLRKSMCYFPTGHHQQHNHTQHDVHQDITEVWPVGRQQGQHRVWIGLRFRAAALKGERFLQQILHKADGWLFPLSPFVDSLCWFKVKSRITESI